jgi:hypothetical protein
MREYEQFVHSEYVFAEDLYKAKSKYYQMQTAMLDNAIESFIKEFESGRLNSVKAMSEQVNHFKRLQGDTSLINTQDL